MFIHREEMYWKWVADQFSMTVRYHHEILPIDNRRIAPVVAKRWGTSFLKLAYPVVERQRIRQDLRLPALDHRHYLVSSEGRVLAAVGWIYDAAPKHAKSWESAGFQVLTARLPVLLSKVTQENCTFFECWSADCEPVTPWRAANPNDRSRDYDYRLWLGP